MNSGLKASQKYIFYHRVSYITEDRYVVKSEQTKHKQTFKVISADIEKVLAKHKQNKVAKVRLNF